MGQWFKESVKQYTMVQILRCNMFKLVLVLYIVPTGVMSICLALSHPLLDQLLIQCLEHIVSPPMYVLPAEPEGPPPPVQAPEQLPTPEEAAALIARDMELEEKLGNLIMELRKQDHMRRLGLLQMDHLVMSLQQENGGVSLPEMIRSLEQEGRNSPYYAQSQSIFSNMRREGLTEKVLHKDFMGRE